MLGLDQPLYVQYGTWLWKALHLDFGISFASQRPVLDDMLNFLPATLELAGAALVLILLTSVPLRYLGGAPSRPSAGFRRTFHRVSWRVDA
ncbi:nickel ABC-transporter, permease protein [Escherichia coli]|uniref:Nickel ABC-transporter, permease protein n=1 Tax=Escherichia coli TaxID=562 RepID=A0A2X3LLQ1_ECOLX|nr:nickel ABC-transporter, permease protein [Escherichia coli]